MVPAPPSSPPTKTALTYDLLFAISGGVVYAPKMRRAGYVTMFDPFQEVYGVRVGALMCIPQFMGDLFWTAAVLSALGGDRTRRRIRMSRFSTVPHA